MVLPSKDRELFLHNFKTICENEGFNESTWTIDLCYILQRFHLPHKYFTTTIGVNPSYNNHRYYDRILSLDAERINKKFAEAANNGICVENRSINSKYLVHHIANNGPIILLTNASLLTCDICKTNKLSSEFRKCLALKPSYSGHYIVLCGYTLDAHKFFYRNPANKDRKLIF